jgi:hypothetical protein
MIRVAGPSDGLETIPFQLRNSYLFWGDEVEGGIGSNSQIRRESDKSPEAVSDLGDVV